MNNLIEDAIMSKRRRGLIKTQEDDLLEKEALIESGRIMGFERGREEGIETGLERGREEGLERGREEGLERGREETKINMIQKLYHKGFNEKDISDTLELDIGYIKQILKTS